MKNLRKVNGTTVNMYGVKFEEDEIKRLVNLANSSNRQVRKNRERQAQVERTVGGKVFGEKVSDYKQRMGKEPQFKDIIKSKSIHQFKTKEGYDAYIKNLERVTDRNYTKKLTDRYRENYRTAVMKEFGIEGRAIIKKIDNMSDKRLREFIEKEEGGEIKYVYSASEREVKLQTIHDALGVTDKQYLKAMEEVDYDFDEEPFDL
jgi:hypothetical protein